MPPAFPELDLAAGGAPMQECLASRALDALARALEDGGRAVELTGGFSPARPCDGQDRTAAATFPGGRHAVFGPTRSAVRKAMQQEAVTPQRGGPPFTGTHTLQTEPGP